MASSATSTSARPLKRQRRSAAPTGLLALLLTPDIQQQVSQYVDIAALAALIACSRSTRAVFDSLQQWQHVAKLQLGLRPQATTGATPSLQLTQLKHRIQRHYQALTVHWHVCTPT